MKILIVNKFLYPNGGSETYIFEIGKQLQKMGHQVQYFGMEHEGRVVGNRLECYTSDMDFRANGWKRLLYPFRILYSGEAGRKLERVLEDFAPDAVHVNNFNFQLTPSILYAVRRYGNRTGKKVRLVYTAHDYQLVCPNHLLMVPATKERCRRCLDGPVLNCVRHNCIHGSKLRSILGSAEGALYRGLHAYRMLDAVICPSRFMQDKLETHPDLRGRTVVMHNFADAPEEAAVVKEDYVLYFGRFCEEKGTGTLLRVCRSLPEIPFVFAGTGPMEDEVNAVPNIENRGFLSGKALWDTVRKARFSVFPSEWYENCPFSVMETQLCGTPVLASDLGGTPELLEDGVTGILFSGGSESELREKLAALWAERDRVKRLTENCRNVSFSTVEQYCEKLVKEIYRDAS